MDGGMRPPAVRVVPIGGRAAGQVLIGVVAVVVEPTAHGRELPECDLVTAWHPRHVAVDRIVKTKFPWSANSRMAITVKLLLVLPMRM